jgi:hypothetical protein
MFAQGMKATRNRYRTKTSKRAKNALNKDPLLGDDREISDDTIRTVS